jgi:PKD repeat protein
MSEASPANMGMSTTFDFMSQTLYITVEIYYTQTVTDINHIYVMLSENDLVSQQSGASGPYTHKHTFREAFVEQWGDPITDPTTQGSLVTLEYSWSAAGSGYIMSNCEVLAFIENQTTGEIITGVGVHVGESTYIEPTADFTVDDNSVAIGGQAVFSDASMGNPSSWEWTFEGGEPSSSTLQTPPPITYNTPGQYGVTLTVTNPAGTNTMTMNNFMDIGYAPEADFSASQTLIMPEEPIDFTDLSTNDPSEWLWEFEGGTPSTSQEQNPGGITYSEIGVYNVTLTATNAYGESMVLKEGYIQVDFVGVDEYQKNQAFTIFPNPSNGILHIQSPQGDRINEITVRTITGQVVYRSSGMDKTEQSLNLSTLENGLYTVEIKSQDQIILEKVVIF